MPDQPDPVPAPAAHTEVSAPHAVPIDPKDTPVTLNGAPLTAGSSIEDLLRADPPPAQVQPPAQEIHEIQGRPAGEAAPPEVPETPTPPAEEPTESEPPIEAAPVDEDVLIERLTEQKRGLLREQGRKNQELGDLRARVRELESVQQAPPVPTQPQFSPEDLAARLLDNPAAVIPQIVSPFIEQRAREIVQQVLAQQTAAWQESQAAEQEFVAPEVGKDLFLTKNKIAGNFDTWVTTEEGKAVNALFERDESRQTLLEAYKWKAINAETPQEFQKAVSGISNTLTKALEAHRIGKKAAQGRAAQNGEKARVDASRPPSNPARTSPPTAPVTREKSIFEPWDDADLANFIRGAPPYVHPDA